MINPVEVKIKFIGYVGWMLTLITLDSSIQILGSILGVVFLAYGIYGRILDNKIKKRILENDTIDDNLLHKSSSAQNLDQESE